MADIHLLRDLQAIDTQLLEKKKELNSVLVELKGSPEMIKARVAAESKATTLAEIVETHTVAAGEITGLKEKQAASNEKLYSGSVTNPRELSDLQMEVESLQRRISALEAKQLEVAGKRKAAKRVKDDAELHLAELEEAWATRSADLEKMKLNLAIGLKAAQTKRKEQVAKISAPLYKTYERILVQNKGIAVVPLRRGTTCGGCSTTVAQATLNQIRSGGVVNCPHCRRIIHV